MKKHFFSPGKLLLTSEYFVLDGALALAVPTKLGQELEVEEKGDQKHSILWETFYQNKSWLKIHIDYHSWEILSTNLPESAKFIVEVLKKVQKLSSIKLNCNKSYFLKSNVQFPSNFGLGSSSTLMNNLSEWSGIDAFVLNEECLGGSGYDIAVAKENRSILYKNTPRSIELVDYHPKFKNELILIHLNKKQDSREGIQHYRSKQKSPELIEEFSKLTKLIFKADTIEDFSQLMTIHEEKISHFLQIRTVKEKYFQNYGGIVKSLGAWGGDFVLASKFGDYKTYFSDRNFKTIFEFDELIN